jgi:hypothetical protein
MEKFPAPTADPEDLREEAANADQELKGDIDMFCRTVNQLDDARRTGDIERLAGLLLYVRLYAQNISSVFTNLADAIEDVIFTYGDPYL